MNFAYQGLLTQVRQPASLIRKNRTKRIFDSIASLLAIILLAPVFILVAIRVKRSSPGPVIYTQERIGLGGKPFTMYKFRSMYPCSEKNGPQLSHPGDARCTAFGVKMRRWGLDELPQLWNVLRGDMSIVGPRPEREFYIMQVMERVPRFPQLLQVRPGITSIGQVYYGYASTVDQIARRTSFDLLYVKNPSLCLDFKILCSTLKVLVLSRNRKYF